MILKSSFTIISMASGHERAATVVASRTSIRISVNGQIARFLVMMMKRVIQSRTTTTSIGEKTQISVRCQEINGDIKEIRSNSGARLQLQASNRITLKERNNTANKCSMSLMNSSISRDRRPSKE